MKMMMIRRGVSSTLHRLCGLALLIPVLGAPVAEAQSIPIGAAAWQDTVTGAISRAFGVGGVPTLNYQDAHGRWRPIVEDFERIGQRQVWRSDGPYTVYADSSGRGHYQKGDHHLGTFTSHLVKFNPADSTWEVLRAAEPDSVVAVGRTVTFYGIFPGVDKRLENRARVHLKYHETIIFRQEARDSLAEWGPWSGRWIGTATRLDTDSLNLSWRDARGNFAPDNAGRLVDGAITFDDQGVTAFGLAREELQQSAIGLGGTGILVRKFIVRKAGQLYLVELFDELSAAALPPGPIWHNATFGETDAGAAQLPIDGYEAAGGAVPPSSGDLDSITGEITTQGTLVQFKLTQGLYTYDAAADSLKLVACGTNKTWGTAATAWESMPLSGSITAETKYWLSAHGNATGAGGIFLRYDQTNPGDGDTVNYVAYTYTTACPGAFDVFKANQYEMSIYVTYTETAAAATPSRRRRLLEGQ